MKISKFQIFSFQNKIRILKFWSFGLKFENLKVLNFQTLKVQSLRLSKLVFYFQSFGIEVLEFQFHFVHFEFLRDFSKYFSKKFSGLGSFDNSRSRSLDKIGCEINSKLFELKQNSNFKYEICLEQFWIAKFKKHLKL